MVTPRVKGNTEVGDSVARGGAVREKSQFLTGRPRRRRRARGEGEGEGEEEDGGPPLVGEDSSRRRGAMEGGPGARCLRWWPDAVRLN